MQYAQLPFMQPMTYRMPQIAPSTVGHVTPKPAVSPSVHQINSTLEAMKTFLAAAPLNWNTTDGLIKKLALPTGDNVSCVYWRNIFYMSGTDIVRCIAFRFLGIGRKVMNMKKFEEGVFSDLRNLKPGTDAALEEPRSEFLDFLHKNNCIRTQKKQKVFFWYSIPHDQLFIDALERDLKREISGNEATTLVVTPNAPRMTLKDLQDTEFLMANKMLVQTYPTMNNQTRAMASLTGSGYTVNSKVQYGMGMSQPRSSKPMPNMASNALPKTFSTPTNTTPLRHDSNPFLHPQTASSIIAKTQFQSIPVQKMQPMPQPEPQANTRYTAPTMMKIEATVPVKAQFPVEQPKQQPQSQTTMEEVSQTFLTEDIATILFEDWIQEDACSDSPLPCNTSTTSSPPMKKAFGYDSAYSSFENLHELLADDRSTSSYTPSISAADITSAFSKSTTFSTPSSSGQASLGVSPEMISRDAFVSPQYNPFPLFNAHTHDHQHYGQPDAYGKLRTNEMIDRRPYARSPPRRGSDASSTGMSGEEKRFECGFMMCGRKFKRYEHLRRHERTHTGEKPYVCTFGDCRKGFARSDNLAQHMKLHAQQPTQPLQHVAVATPESISDSQIVFTAEDLSWNESEWLSDDSFSI